MAKNEKAMDGRVRYFGELKAKAKDAILLFRCGDFYEAYYEDAKVVAEVCGVTLTRENGNGGYKCGFPHHDLDVYLPKLVRAGKRIAICDEITINDNSKNSEDNTMRLNMDANNNETKNVAMQPQVNNASSSESRAESHSSYAESQEGSAKANNPIEDAVAVEITTEADVQEVDDIAPKVTKRVEPKEEPKPQAVTVPLSDHGTLVVGGVPKPAMPQRDKNGKFMKKGSAPSSRPSEASGEISRQARDDNQLTKVQLVVYKTKKGADAPMIVGFSGEDDPRWKALRDAKHKWASVGYRRDLEGNKTYHVLFGTKYMDVAKALAEAYNTDDRKAWEAAEQACEANYDSIVNGYKAEKEARKAERAAAREAAKPAEPAPKCYTNEDVAAMLRKVMAGGDVPEDIKKLLKAA